MPRFSARIVVVALLVLAIGEVRAEDWPEWRGVGRRGIWSERGILEKFPERGLKVSWRVPIREGYAGPAVANGRVYVMDFARGKGTEGAERALALDEQTGKLLWQLEWKVSYSGTEPKWANGPRATPTVDGGRVYFLGAMGRLVCLEASTGKLVWERDYIEQYGAVAPTWGIVSAPIVFEGSLIALVGGEDGALVVAFDKKTGKERWRSLAATGEAGYAPPILVDAGGAKQLIVWHPRAVTSLDPANGNVYWEQPFEVRMGMTVATPVFDDGRLFVSAFFDGSMMLSLDREKPAAKRVWQQKGASEMPADTRALHSLITTPVLDGDHIFGVDSYGELRGLRAKDGERVWESLDLLGEKARWAAGLIVRQGDRYFVNTDRGDLVIARLTPEGYRELDRTHLIEPTTGGGGRRELGAVLWTHPAYANRHIVVRNDREILRASLEKD